MPKIEKKYPIKTRRDGTHYIVRIEELGKHEKGKPKCKAKYVLERGITCDKCGHEFKNGEMFFNAFSHIGRGYVNGCGDMAEIISTIKETFQILCINCEPKEAIELPLGIFVSYLKEERSVDVNESK